MSPMHPWRVPMRARSPHEPHRTATPLELLFDLVFVVALSLWWLHYRPGTLAHIGSGPLAVLLILATPFAAAEFAVPIIGVILAILLALKIAMRAAEVPAATTGEAA